MFSHFKSKEQLQLQTLEHARSRFVDVIVRPALAAPRGEPRLRALVEHWRTWDSVGLEGGCIFTAAAFELGEQPGPLRDALVRSELDWLELLGSVSAAAVREGQFRPDLDPEQLAFEIHGVLLSHHYASRLLADQQAGRRTALALDRIIAGARDTEIHTGAAATAVP